MKRIDAPSGQSCGSALSVTFLVTAFLQGVKHWPRCFIPGQRPLTEAMAPPLNANACNRGAANFTRFLLFLFKKGDYGEG